MVLIINNVGGIHGNFGVRGYYGTDPKTAKYTL